MPWMEMSPMSLRREFVVLASRAHANVRQLCRRFGISPTTGYRWLRRYREGASAGLAISTQEVFVPADGVLVVLTIDTTGFQAGTWDLLLSGILGGHDTDFAGVPANIINGTITVVPEPGTLSLLAAFALGLCTRKRSGTSLVLSDA